MAFSEFKTLGDVQVRYGIRFREERFVDAQPVSPSAYFLEEF